MKNTHFTRQERFIVDWLRFLVIGFLGIGLTFATIPNILFQYIDSIGLVFFNYKSLPIEENVFHLWWVLSLTLLLVLVVACFLAQRDWLRYCQLVPTVILAKGASFAGLLALTLLQPTHFFYLVGSIVDGLLFFSTWYFYAQAIKSRSFTAHTN